MNSSLQFSDNDYVAGDCTQHCNPIKAHAMMAIRSTSFGIGFSNLQLALSASIVLDRDDLSNMHFKEIIGRLTGISCPVFGISWNPLEPDIIVARRVLASLEDRRVLYATSDFESIKDCVASVLEIRRLLTEEIGKLAESDGVAKQLRGMRAACRSLLDNITGIETAQDGGIRFFVALGEFRSRMGVHIGILAVMYGLSIEETLETILPPHPEEATG